MTAIDNELGRITEDLKSNTIGSDFEKLQVLHDSQNKLESEYLVLMYFLEGLRSNI